MACAAMPRRCSTSTARWVAAAAFDLNTIPVLALSQVEVLRDGASAQYGSDAIAGVSTCACARPTMAAARPFPGASMTPVQRRAQLAPYQRWRHADLSLWQGFKLGNNGGFLTVTSEYLDRRSTGRSDTTSAKPTPSCVRASAIPRCSS
jgi:iron complex outermembrane receptor protein